MVIDLLREDSGWHILDGLTRAILPRSGARTNLVTEVESLAIYGQSKRYKGDTMMDVINRANRCEETIQYCGAKLGKNQFFEKVLKLLNACPETNKYMLKINSKYTKHHKSYLLW